MIPVILRPCDWQALPFGKLLVTPRDGRPITMWPNIDEAFLDVVTSIKAALSEMGLLPKRGEVTEMREPRRAEKPVFEAPRSSNLRTKKQF